jgi:TRAP-type C4-dicarboxylate transport system permease small subunit
MKAIFAQLTQQLARIAIVISTAGLVLMTFIIGWQVFARYVLNASPAWSESAALLLMLYYIMLAAAVGVYENFHLGLKVVLDAVPTHIRTRLEVINNSLVIIFGIAMLVNGSRLALFTVEHIMPALNISRSFAYWPFAAAGLFISIFALERLILAINSENYINPPKNTEAVKR